MFVFKVRKAKRTGKFMGINLYNGLLVKIKGEYYIPLILTPSFHTNLLNMLTQDRLQKNYWKILKVLGERLPKYYSTYLQKPPEITEVIPMKQFTPPLMQEEVEPFYDITIGMFKLWDYVQPNKKKLAFNTFKYVPIKPYFTLVYSLYKRAYFKEEMNTYTAWIVKESFIPLLGFNSLIKDELEPNTIIKVAPVQTMINKLIDKTSGKPFFNMLVSPFDNPYWYGFFLNEEAYHKNKNVYLGEVIVFDKNGGIRPVFSTGNKKLSHYENLDKFTLYNTYLKPIMSYEHGLLVIEHTKNKIMRTYRNVWTVPEEYIHKYKDTVKDAMKENTISNFETINQLQTHLFNTNKGLQEFLGKVMFTLFNKHYGE